MRIWLCPSAFFPHRGGVEELSLQLAKSLVRRGHQVLVVTNRWPAHLPERESVEGVDVARLPFTLAARRPASIAGHLRALRPIALALQGLPFPPDVIHVQCASSQLQHLRRHAGRTGVPLVLSTQGETVMDANRLYQQNPWMRRELRKAARRAAALTACSSWTRDITTQTAPDFVHAKVVLNGVEPTDWPMADVVTEPVFAAWGRHVPQKGLDLLLKAFAVVREQEPTAQLLLGGDGPETPALQALAGAGVTFLGGLDRKGVADLLSRSRVVVVPSRIEPFGIVAVEALASGRGLVYSPHGGLAEAAGGCGRQADPLDERDLANAMLAELRDPTAAVQGRARAESLSWDRITDAYEDIYRQVGVSS